MLFDVWVVDSVTGVQILTLLQPLDGLNVVMYADEGEGRNYRSSKPSTSSLFARLKSLLEILY